jgi:hypothetical protein
MTSRIAPFIGAVALSVGVFLPAVADAEPVGFLAVVHGTVEIQPKGATAFQAALRDRDIEIGDTLRTGRDSALKAILADETILTLGAESELLVEEFVVGAAATRDPSTLRLLRGRVRAIVGEAFGGTTRLEMHTPTAVIGVKGTDYDATVRDEDETFACNLDGHIWVRPIGKDEDIEPEKGFCFSVFKDGSSQGPFPAPPGLAVTADVPDPGLSEQLTSDNGLFTDPPPVGAGGDGFPTGTKGGPKNIIEDITQVVTKENPTLPSLGSSDGIEPGVPFDPDNF